MYVAKSEKTMKFCEECGTLIRVDIERKLLVCGKCGDTKDISNDDDIAGIMGLYRIKIGDSEERREPIVIISDKYKKLKPTRQANCPYCENHEAYYRIIPPRWGDEGDLIIYKCTKCGRGWREGFSY